MSGNQQKFQHSRFSDRAVAAAFDVSLYELRKLAVALFAKKTTAATCAGSSWEFDAEGVEKVAAALKIEGEDMAKKMASLRAQTGQELAKSETKTSDTSAEKKQPALDLVVLQLLPNPAWVRASVNSKPVDVFVKNNAFIRAAIARMGANKRPIVLRGCRMTAEASLAVPARYEWEGAK